MTLRLKFWISTFFFQNIFWVYNCGIFGETLQNWTILLFFFYFFYFKVKVRNLNIFWGCKIKNTFLGMHDISDILFDKR